MIKVYLIVGGCAAALLTFSHIYVYNAGKSAVRAQLAEARVQILKDGKEIDAEVLAADDAELCRLLGGCVLPDLN